jgi:uncharacterized protein with HEPN domain
MRRDDLYLNDIVEAADHIATFLGQVDFDSFLQSELIRSAVVQKLAIIGEAAARTSDELTGRFPQIPWPQIVAFRNILIVPLVNPICGAKPALRSAPRLRHRWNIDSRNSSRCRTSRGSSKCLPLNFRTVTRHVVGADRVAAKASQAARRSYR